jgi:hypothetical protein
MRPCKIWGFHGDDYAGNRLLGSCAVYYWLEPTFRRNVSLPSSGQVNRDENIVSSVCKFSSRFTFPEDGGDTFLRNVGSNQKYTAKDPRRRFHANMRPFLGFIKISNAWRDVLSDRPVPSSSKFSPFTPLLCFLGWLVNAPQIFRYPHWSIFTDVGRLPICFSLRIVTGRNLKLFTTHWEERKSSHI